MADTNFKVFAESSTDIISDAEYEVDGQRINGVEPGLAKSKLHNKIYKQASVMAAAIAQVITERGFDAMDDDYTGLVESLRQAFAYSVNDKKPNATGNIDYRLLNFDDIYPVGSIYISARGTDPGALFGGVWQSIAGGRCLIGANNAYKAGGTGGEETHVLTTKEMPKHSHTASVSKNGEHKHNRGTMEITGTFAADDSARAGHHGELPTGAFYDAGRVNLDLDSSSGNGTRVGFKASNAWTGETSAVGAHAHTCTIGNFGDGGAHNNMQPYLVVYIWQRIG